MKKKFIYLFAVFGLLFSTTLSAEPQEVPKLPKEQSLAKKKNWQPWAVAIVTVLVATTGIVVVAKDPGKRAH